MALEVQWFELFPESRSSQIDRSNISKDFSFIVCGNWVENAEIDPILEANFESSGIMDDDLVQREVYRVFAPLVYTYNLSNTETYTLYFANCSIVQLTWNIWKVTLQYDIPQDGGQSLGGGGTEIGPNAGEPPYSQEFTQVSFDTSPGTKHIKTARYVGWNSAYDPNNPTQLLFPNSGYVGNSQVPIGATLTEIKGMEIPERSFKFSITQYRPPSKLRYAYVRRLFRLTTCTNEDDFFGFPAGSVMFQGATAQGDLYKNVPVTYNFEAKPNYKLSKTGPSKPADPDVDDPALMFDIIHDPDFNDREGGPGEFPGNAISGWTIIDYRFMQTLTPSETLVIDRPVQRFILMPYTTEKFSKLEL